MAQRGTARTRARVRTGVILAGGSGSDPIAGIHGLRVLAPIANKPILCYALEDLARAGIEQVAIVVSPQAREATREMVTDGARWGVRVAYVEQAEPLGDAHALLAAEEFVDGRPFAVHRGDGLLRPPLRPLLDEFARSDLDALVLVKRAAQANRSLAGAHAFGARIFEAARGLAPSWRGRLEMADAADRLAATGGRVAMRPVEGWWAYDGSPAELLRANRLELDDLTADVRGVDLADCQVDGRVAIDPSATLASTTVRGPAIVGPGVRLSHAYVGPYTSLGAGVTLEGVEIENSIILPGAVIRHLGRRLEGSVVGSEAKVHRDFALPAALRLWVGDRVEVSLG